MLKSSTARTDQITRGSPSLKKPAFVVISLCNIFYEKPNCNSGFCKLPACTILKMSAHSVVSEKKGKGSTQNFRIKPIKTQGPPRYKLDTRLVSHVTKLAEKYVDR